MAIYTIPIIYSMWLLFRNISFVEVHYSLWKMFWALFLIWYYFIHDKLILESWSITRASPESLADTCWGTEQQLNPTSVLASASALGVFPLSFPRADREYTRSGCISCFPPVDRTCPGMTLSRCSLQTLAAAQWGPQAQTRQQPLFYELLPGSSDSGSLI